MRSRDQVRTGTLRLTLAAPALGGEGAWAGR